MSKRRVVVTGLGAVTPVGNNVQAFWESVKTGKVGIGEITRFDTADFKVKLAAEVKDFNAKDYMDFKSWCKGKMHQRSDCLCVWNTLYRRCISCNPVW